MKGQDHHIVYHEVLVFLTFSTMEQENAEVNAVTVSTNRKSFSSNHVLTL